MSLKIFFIEKSIPFNASDLDNPSIGGAEKALINITNELSNNSDLLIKVFNLNNNKEYFNNVEWNNINKIDKEHNPDCLIAFSDANLLSLMNAKKKILWSHSVQSIEKFIRKKQLFSFLKNKPLVILEGEYHFQNRSFLTSFFGKKIIRLAVDYDFINSKVDNDFLPVKNAIFTTRSDRNLDMLIDYWKEIKSKTENSNLLINPPFETTEYHKKLGIKVRSKGLKRDLINDLINSRVMLVPGHKGEVFCLAAEEARELCLPIVTMGIGSLYERVEHNVTGFIARNKSEFIDYSTKILNDDKLYMKIKDNLVKMRNKRSYKNVIKDLLEIINYDS